jgi:hypothetical protein
VLPNKPKYSKRAKLCTLDDMSDDEQNLDLHLEPQIQPTNTNTSKINTLRK